MTQAKKKELTFDNALVQFVRSTKSAMVAARACAFLSLAHFAEHGDTIQCQRFLDAMATSGKNFVRRTAYVKWLCAFAPIKLEGGKFVKDQDRKAMVIDMTAAQKTDFWDFAPEAPILNYNDADAFKKLASAFAMFKKANVKVTTEFLAALKKIEDYAEEQKAALKVQHEGNVA